MISRFNKRLNHLSLVLGLDLNYFLGGGFWIGLSLIASLITGIIISSLFSHLWSAEIFGQYSFFISVFSFVTLTALPGMGQIVLQATAEKKDGVYIQAIKEVLKWSIVGSFILVAIAVYFFTKQNQSLGFIFFVSGLIFPFSNSSNLYTSFLNGKRLFKQTAILSTLVQLITLITTFLALLFFPTLLGVSLIILIINALISLIITFITTKQVKNNIQDQKLINFGQHLSSSQVVTFLIDYLDRFTVPLILGFTNNAIYTFALLIPIQIHSFLKLFITLGQTKIASSNPKELQKNLLQKSIQLEIIITLIVFVYIFTAPAIFSLLYPNYLKSALFLSQLFSLSLLYFPSNLFGLALIKYQAKKELYTVNIVYLISSILTLLIFLPFFGLVGVVFSKIISRFLQGLSQYILFKKFPIRNYT